MRVNLKSLSRPLFLFDGDCGVCQKGTDFIQENAKPDGAMAETLQAATGGFRAMGRVMTTLGSKRHLRSQLITDSLASIP